MGSSDKAYISAENASDAVTWLPPHVGKQANKIPSAEKEAKEAKRREQERAKERVEDVEPPKLPSAEEIAQVFDAARKEGFAEGLAAGTAQGLEQGRLDGAERAYAEQQAELDQLKLTLSQMIVNLSGPTEAEQQKLSDVLSQLVKRLTRKLVLTELSTPNPHIENLVSACVALLPATQTSRKARIQLHPDDLAYIRGEAQLTSILAACEWVADPDVKLGGCLVSAHSSQVDASVESQLQSLFTEFDNGSFSHDAADDDIIDDRAEEAAYGNSDSDPIVDSFNPSGLSEQPQQSKHQPGEAMPFDDADRSSPMNEETSTSVRASRPVAQGKLGSESKPDVGAAAPESDADVE